MIDDPPRQRDKRSRDVATLVALVGLVLVAFGLLALLALVLQQVFVFAIGMFVVIFGLYLGFHYVVWGRGLGQRAQQQADPTHAEGKPDPESLPTAEDD